MEAALTSRLLVLAEEARLDHDVLLDSLLDGDTEAVVLEEVAEALPVDQLDRRRPVSIGFVLRVPRDRVLAGSLITVTDLTEAAYCPWPTAPRLKKPPPPGRPAVRS